MAHILDASFRNRYFDASDAEMAIQEMKRLERLDLSSNDIERPPRLPSTLISLNLSFNPRCQQLSGLAVSNLHGLRELIITNNELNSTSGLSHLSSLEILNLGNNKIRKLAGLELLSELKVLILVSNSISTVVALRCLSCNYNLESLDMRGNPVCKIPNYATVRNMIGESLVEMDGKMVKAQKFTTNKAAHSSSVADQSYLYYARGGNDVREKYTSIEDRASPTKYKVLRRNTLGHEQLRSSSPSFLGTPSREQSPRGLGDASTHSSASASATTATATASSGGNGYAAQYQVNSIQKQAEQSAHGKVAVSVAGGFALNPEKRENSYLGHFNHYSRLPGHSNGSSSESKRHGDESSEEDGEQQQQHFKYNGDGMPRARKVVNHNGEPSVSYYNPPQHHARYGQEETGSLEGRSKMLAWYHLHKKSPLPWRNAPDVKPRPWKGWHYEDVGDRQKAWEATIGEHGKEMFNRTPWVSPVTVVAYDREAHNVSNESYYKKMQIRKEQQRRQRAGYYGGEELAKPPSKAELMQRYGPRGGYSPNAAPAAKKGSGTQPGHNSKNRGSGQTGRAAAQYDEDEVFYASVYPPQEGQMLTPGMTPIAELGQYRPEQEGAGDSSLDYSLSFSRASTRESSPIRGARANSNPNPSPDRRRASPHRGTTRSNESHHSEAWNLEYSGATQTAFGPTAAVANGPHYLQPTFAAYTKTSPVRHKYSHGSTVGSPDYARIGGHTGGNGPINSKQHMSHAKLLEKMHKDPDWAAFQADKSRSEGENVSPLEKLALVELAAYHQEEGGSFTHSVVDMPPSPPLSAGGGGTGAGTGTGTGSVFVGVVKAPVTMPTTESGELARVSATSQGSGTTPGADPGQVMVETLRGILTEVYTEHNPSKLPALDTIIETFEGRERDLVVSLCNKYGLDKGVYLKKLVKAQESHEQDDERLGLGTSGARQTEVRSLLDEPDQEDGKNAPQQSQGLDVSYVSTTDNEESRISVNDSQIYVSNVRAASGKVAPGKEKWDGTWFVDKQPQSQEEETNIDLKQTPPAGPVLEEMSGGKDVVLHSGWWGKTRKLSKVSGGSGAGGSTKGGDLASLQSTLDKVG